MLYQFKGPSLLSGSGIHARWHTRAPYITGICLAAPSDGFYLSCSRPSFMSPAFSHSALSPFPQLSQLLSFCKWTEKQLSLWDNVKYNNIFFLHCLISYLLLFYFLSHSYWCSCSNVVITNFRSVREKFSCAITYTSFISTYWQEKKMYSPITGSWLQFPYSFTAKIIAELEELHLCLEEKKQALEMMLCACAGEFAFLQGLFFRSQERDLSARIVWFHENIFIWKDIKGCLLIHRLKLK